MNATFTRLLADAVRRLRYTLSKRVEVCPSSKKPEDVADWVRGLFEESRTWRSKSMRGRLGQDDPVTWWKNARLLEQGLHWNVYGHRNTAAEDKWKSELVDNETGNQCRMKRSYLGANWHDITIRPNVANLDQIEAQERQDTGWTDSMLVGISRGITEGTNVWKSIFDVSEDPRGLVREIPLDNASLFPNRGSTGLSELEGNWALIIGTVETIQSQLEEFPDLDPERLRESSSAFFRDLGLEADMRPASSGSGSVLGQITGGTGLYTDLVDRLEVWMDDPTVEPIPAPPEEIEPEHAGLHQGQSPEVLPEQNHSAHVRAHMDWLEGTVLSQEPETDEDAQFQQAVFDLTMMHVEDHDRAAGEAKASGMNVNFRKKYPLGRKIVVISGQVAEDIPNPFAVNWRRLFHKWDVEKLPGHFWGRGIPETLYETNKTEDTMMSYIADMGLSVSTPKAYFSLEDKTELEGQTIDNDPTHPVFVSEPPTFRKGESPREPFELYKIAKADAQKQQGITDVTYGQAPGADSSGKLIQVMLQQNQVIVTGEAQIRLSEQVASMQETRLQLQKQLYIEPRFWLIDGEFQIIDLPKLLSELPVRNPATGEVVPMDVPKFQITVRPNSNFPYQWEYDTQFLLQLAALKDDPMGLIPKEAIYDQLAQRFPKFARGGDYYRMSQAMQAGLQVLQAQAVKAKQEQADLQKVAAKYKSLGTDAVIRGASSGGSQVQGTAGGDQQADLLNQLQSQ